MPPPPLILIAEDDDPSREMLLRRLERRGFVVDAVADGQSCLDWLAKQTPDLALLDIQMPGASGLEIVRQIRTRFSYDVLPVILVTALGEIDDVVRGLEAGANDYVVKPIILPVLLARIGVAMRIQQSVRLVTEADRQRVLIAALGEACHQLSQPMQAVLATLESLIRNPPADAAQTVSDLAEVREWTLQVSDVIHRLQTVGTVSSVPYVQRMALLDRGTPQDQGQRPTGERPA
jgi:DNA-binding response OmpR family regulator